MSCDVGHRLSLDLVLLWLWYRSEAVASVRPLTWELSHALGVALKRQKIKKKKKGRETCPNPPALEFKCSPPPASLWDVS